MSPKKVLTHKKAKEIAEALGVDESSVQRWEAGKQDPSEENLTRVEELADEGTRSPTHVARMLHGLAAHLCNSLKMLGSRLQHDTT